MKGVSFGTSREGGRERGREAGREERKHFRLSVSREAMTARGWGKKAIERTSLSLPNNPPYLPPSPPPSLIS